MATSTVNPAHQAFILARLSEFCQYHAKVRHDNRDPWQYMRDKLLQIEPELAALKQELLAATARKLLSDWSAGPLDAEACADWKHLFERLLSRGDFVDVAMNLEPGASPEARKAAADVLARAKPTSAFQEERKPAAEREPSYERLVGEISRRLNLDVLEKILKRKKRTPRRNAMVLRRLRRNVAEYCTVVRIPTRAEDTFTPFMLPRVEAVLGACLRFLNAHR